MRLRLLSRRKREQFRSHTMAKSNATSTPILSARDYVTLLSARHQSLHALWRLPLNIVRTASVKNTKHWITHNWFLKVVSLMLAVLLWVALSNPATSEIGIEVPLEYRNIPAHYEITGDTTSSVQVRLR